MNNNENGDNKVAFLKEKREQNQKYGEQIMNAAYQVGSILKDIWEETGGDCPFPADFVEATIEAYCGGWDGQDLRGALEVIRDMYSRATAITWLRGVHGGATCATET